MKKVKTRKYYGCSIIVSATSSKWSCWRLRCLE